MAHKMILIILLFSFVMGPASGWALARQDADALPDATDMAQFFPADTLIFAATTLPDSSIIDAYEAQLGPDVLAELQAPGGPETLRGLLDEQLAEFGTDTDSLFAMFGDQAALGFGRLNSATGEPESVYALVEVDDRAAVEDLLEAVGGDELTRKTSAEATIFSSTNNNPGLAVTDEFVILFDTTAGLPALSLDESLADSDGFKAAMNTLLEPLYNDVMYIDAPMLLGLDDVAGFLAPLGITTETTGPLAIASVFLPEINTSILDTVQLPGTDGGAQFTAAIDKDFARFIPQNASFAIHARDLSGLFDSLTGLAAELSGGQDPTAELAQPLALFGIDLQPDVLSWTTGDYALFASIDFEGILRGALKEDFSALGESDFGVVIEATDPQTAQAFAATLDGLARVFLSEQPGITVSPDTFGTVETTRIQAKVPLSASDSIALDITVGASDEVFFVGTRDAAIDVFDGEGGLPENPDYLDAARFLLPDPTVVAYGDGAGMLVGTAVPLIGILALLGPAIGNVFEDIVTELDAPQGGFDPQPQFTTLQTEDPTEQIIQQFLDGFEGVNMSFSATITPDGATMTRIVITSEAEALFTPVSLLLAPVGVVVGFVLFGTSIADPFNQF